MYQNNQTNRNLDRLCQLHSSDKEVILPPKLVIGVDEVGRGALFANMTVAAVILPQALTGYLSDMDLSNTPLALINDSKKLTEKRREKLFEPIKDMACAYVLVDIPRQVIDQINISQATLLGMRVAIEYLVAQYGLQAQNTSILIDGNSTPLLDQGPAQAFFTQSIIKGDSQHSSIACASVLAKVHRDRQMLDYAALFPEYAIEKHKGYLTAAHKQAIMTYGILPEHRRSYSPITELYHSGHLNQTHWSV